jgi:hypothetical protein
MFLKQESKNCEFEHIQYLIEIMTKIGKILFLKWFIICSSIAWNVILIWLSIVRNIILNKLFESGIGFIMMKYITLPHSLSKISLWKIESCFIAWVY